MLNKPLMGIVEKTLKHLKVERENLKSLSAHGGVALGCDGEP